MSVREVEIGDLEGVSAVFPAGGLVGTDAREVGKAVGC